MLQVMAIDTPTVTLSDLSYSGKNLSIEEQETIQYMLITAMVNTYSFNVIETDWNNKISTEEILEQFQKIDTLDGVFTGVIHDSFSKFRIELSYYKRDKTTPTTFKSERFNLNEIDTIMETLINRIAIELVIVIPKQDIDSCRIIAYESDKKTATIDIGLVNIDRYLQYGIEKNFIYVLYFNGKEINRGVVKTVYEYHSTIKFQKKLPEDILSTPGYNLILYGYIPRSYWSFTGPFAMATRYDGPYAGFQMDFGYSWMLGINFSLDLSIGYTALLDTSSILPNTDETDYLIETDNPYYKTYYERQIWTPFGVSYYLNTIGDFVIVGGIGLAIVIGGDTNYVPYYSIKLIPFGRKTTPNNRKSRVMFAPLFRIIPASDDVYITAGMGVTW